MVLHEGVFLFGHEFLLDVHGFVDYSEISLCAEPSAHPFGLKVDRFDIETELETDPDQGTPSPGQEVPMSEQTRGQKWLLIGFFGAIALFFLYFILFVASGKKVDPRYSSVPLTDRVLPSQAGFDGKLRLEKDRPFEFETLKLTYKGMKDGQVVLDVVIIPLDAAYAYRHHIPKSLFGRPVRVGGRDIIVRSVSRNRLYLSVHSR